MKSNRVKLKKLWLVLVTFSIAVMIGGCGPETEPDDMHYYRMHNKTDLTIRVEIPTGEPEFKKSLLSPDLVKTIFINNTLDWANPMIKIYDDNSDDSPLLEQYLEDFNIHHAGFDPAIRDKEETFYPGEDEHDYYIFLTAEDLTADASND